jgi:hypothetical protein
MIPQQVWYYARDALCQAWVADALRHGSQAGVARKLGLTRQEFSHIKHGRAGLSPRILAQLGLSPVRERMSGAIVGYISEEPVDFARQWTEEGCEERARAVGQ